MKNIFAALMMLMVLGSCDKQEFQDTKDTINKADSLFTKANQGLKTLDSISKRINDTDGIAKKVIIPQIEKQTKRIDSTLRSGSWKIDSLNRDIAEISKHVKTGTDVARTLDSASQMLKNGENAISVLSKTADKILKRTQTQKATPPNSPQEEEATINNNNTVVVPSVVKSYPVKKSAQFEIQVDDLSEAKAMLKQNIRENNADIVSQNFAQNEGFERENISIKVPLQNFNQMVNDLSRNIGEVKSKNTSSEGNDYVADQLCDIELTLVQNSNFANTNVVNKEFDKDPDSFGSKSSSAFNSGFSILEDVALAILPFWPLFLLAGLILFFVRRSTKSKDKMVPHEQPKSSEKLKVNLSQPFNAPPTDLPKESGNTEEPDYSKYLPKK